MGALALLWVIVSRDLFQDFGGLGALTEDVEVWSRWLPDTEAIANIAAAHTYPKLRTMRFPLPQPKSLHKSIAEFHIGQYLQKYDY
ncbi:MAG: hypothetical protein K2J17_04335 [Paramuribaculum sp.]|nr:hypothetical protein [Paramuribaculum sp.]